MAPTPVPRLPRSRMTLALFLSGVMSLANPAFSQSDVESVAAKQKTATPIKHVIVLIGENRTFDHLFATYVSPSGDSVNNLLSEGVIKADGTPGRHFGRAKQFQAIAPFKKKYFISLDDDDKDAYGILPEPTLNFAPIPKPLPAGDNSFQPLANFPPGTPTNFLAMVEPSLETKDLPLLTTGVADFTQTVVQPDPDTRVQNFNTLPNGPFPLKGTDLPYDSYTGDTTHRLFEMWQQSDCNIENATRRNPSGCLSDLYPFVITTYTNILDSFDTPPAIDDNGGGNSMAFYNMQAGDVPVLKQLADQYTMSDNYHQAFMGGTGANHVMLGTGDAIFWSDGNGNPTTPPSHIANPDPLAGTDNVYTVDVGFDGNFTECADPNQPGIKPIRDYLRSLPYRPNPNCQKGHYYMVNNDSPGFLPDGTIDAAGIAKGPRFLPSTSAPSAKHSTRRTSPGPTTGGRTTLRWICSTIRGAPIQPYWWAPLTATFATLNRIRMRSWAIPINVPLISRMQRISSPPSTVTNYHRYLTSSRTACWTATRRPPSLTCSKPW
jgi:phospholipase C